MISFSKQPYESFPISADFSANMETGETISTCTATAINKASGEAANVIDSPSPQGHSATARVYGGDAGKIYTITFQVETSSGNKWELDIGMRVE